LGRARIDVGERGEAIAMGWYNRYRIVGYGLLHGHREEGAEAERRLACVPVVKNQQCVSKFPKKLQSEAAASVFSLWAMACVVGC
jgi:hypothetical protein